MGLIKLFSSSKFDDVENNCSPQNPDPNHYKILDYQQVGEFLVMKIQYDGCTNYEGKKICIFNSTIEDIKRQKLIDPHFSNNENFISPCARLKPTAYGWELALRLAKIMNNDLIESRKASFGL